MLPLSIAGWIFRKVAVVLAGEGVSKGLGLLVKEGKNNRHGSDRANRLADGASVRRETAEGALANKTEI